MKKMSKEKIIDLLHNKSDYTYNELAALTGYHPKSLVRINTMIKKNEYTIIQSKKNKMYENIINNYLNGNYKTYKEFYNSNLFEYDISYSTLCKILRDSKFSKEIVIIRKIKNKGNYYFEVADYTSKSILFTYNSLKNDTKSIKNIIYLLLKNYGYPQNITFANFFSNIPSSIQYLLSKYKINIISFKSSYRGCFNQLSKTVNVKYRQGNIIKEDFYNIIAKKTIANNTIQFNNIRYRIKTNFIIKRNSKIILYYDNEKKDLFIKYNNIFFKLIPFQVIDSKKDLSKYN